MSSVGTIPLGDIWVMLDECAKGHTRSQKTHNWIIRYKDKTRKLPLGPHGRRQNPEIQKGHVRGLVRHFEIVECAEKHLPQL